jgi:HEAT repeat protein
VGLGGPEVVATLVQGLSSDETQLRWESAKALWALHAADTSDALVGVLLKDQEDHGIQWIAAEALILQRTRGIRALLRALEVHADAPTLTSGARHVLRELREDAQLGEIVAPVFEALDRSDPAVHAPLAARSALRALDGVEEECEPRSVMALAGPGSLAAPRGEEAGAVSPRSG